MNIVPPGQDGAGQPLAVPEIPKLRLFVLTRMNPLGPYDQEDNFIGRTETLHIYAHEVEINQAGNILRFREYVFDPTDGPTNRVVRCFNGWIDYAEVVPEPSQIIRPV